MAVDDSYTKVLLHCDGSDASTTITDESGKSWTAGGNAQIDTAQSKFGGGSLLFDGNADYVYTADHADFTLGTNDFTVDFWVRFNQITYAALFTIYTDANNCILFYLYTDGNILLQSISGGSLALNVTQAWTPSTGTWYHVAAVRYGNVWRIFVNGNKLGNDVTDSRSIPDYTGGAAIGYRPANSAGSLNGWIDEFRFSKGIARWTANFTPPTAAYAPPSAFKPKIIMF